MLLEGSFTSSFFHMLINFGIFMFFALYSFKGKFKYRSIVHVPLIVGYLAVTFALIMLFMLETSPFYHPQYTSIFVAFLIGIAVFMAFLLLRSCVFQLLFFVFAMFNFGVSILQISAILDELNVIPRIFITEDIQGLFVHLLVAIAFLPAMWYLFIELFKKVINMDIDNSHWRYLFSVPIFAYLYSEFSLYYFKGEKTWGVLAIVAFFNFLTLFACITILQLLIKTHETLLANEKAGMSERQLFIQSEQYKKLADDVSQTQQLRHDMRHHFIALKGFVVNGDLSGANNYLDNCIGKELPEGNVSICERHSVDMILRHYIAEARSAGVEVETSVNLTGGFRVSDTDICLIFGNLIENAVESCKRQHDGRKFITAKAKIISESMLAVTITNSYDGEILCNGDDFVSRKHSGNGIGTQSVRSIVERSGGSCCFSFKENVFTASVLLNIS